MLDGVDVDDQGNYFWYQNGLLHRIDRPTVINANGDRFWYQNDQLHRIDGPAIEYANGNRYWYQNDQVHRIDGPAVKWTNGAYYWYINGVEITKEVNAWLQENNITWPFDASAQILFQLRFAYEN